jgi:DNA polymerase III epsilon subunit-like protein
MNAFDRIVEGYIPYGDNPFKMIKNRKIVFFDTETTGFKPASSQITEIGAIIVDGNTLQEEAEYHQMIELNAETEQRLHTKVKPGEMSVSDILKMTGYYDQSGERAEERTAIDGLNNFIPQGCILCAHNAKFDMKMVNSRAKRLGTDPIRGQSKVLDTMIMNQQFFVPMSQELEMNDEVDINIKNKAKQQLHKLSEEWGKTRRGAKYSSKLGNMSKAFTGEVGNWHTAVADSRMAIGIFKELKQFFDTHFNSELKYNHDFIRRYKRQIDRRKGR